MTMRSTLIRTIAAAIAAVLTFIISPPLQAETPRFNTILYGASYYWE
jgi:uncharacterized membrane protein YgaE (UPF0421/DUF939 family)